MVVEETGHNREALDLVVVVVNSWVAMMKAGKVEAVNNLEAGLMENR